MVPDIAGGAPEQTPQAVNEANKVCGLQQVGVTLQWCSYFVILTIGCSSNALYHMVSMLHVTRW
jgi:hypothetical protein